MPRGEPSCCTPVAPTPPPLSDGGRLKQEQPVPVLALLGTEDSCGPCEALAWALALAGGRMGPARGPELETRQTPGRLGQAGPRSGEILAVCVPLGYPPRLLLPPSFPPSFLAVAFLLPLLWSDACLPPLLPPPPLLVPLVQQPLSQWPSKTRA